MNITDRLIERIEATNNASVVGLDPALDFVPDFLKGVGGGDDASVLLEFNKRLIDAIFDVVPAVKPQIAFYERFGRRGYEAYLETVEYAHDKGLIVIADIKRGDIASTAAAYADGHLARSSADFVTLNPYMGTDAISPFLAVCAETGKGAFVLVKTSNPSSGDIQDLKLETGEPLYERVARLTEGWGANLPGKRGYSAVGAVVGATYPEQAAVLRGVMPRTFFLVPGYGAQGGTAEDLRPCFDARGSGAIVNSSRGVIAAWKSEKYKHFGAEGFAEAARAAAIDMRDDINRVRGL